MTADAKRVSQAQFDDAVRDFIESLELEPSEAVQTAVEEFKMQGLDMAGVDTVWPPESRSVSPLSVAVGVVRDHVVNTDVPLTAEVVKALAAIAAIMAAKEGRESAAALAGDEFAMTHVLAAAKRASAAGQEAAAVQVMETARSLMAASKSLRRDFARDDGVGACRQLLQAHRDAPAVVTATARACEAATLKCEANKGAMADEEVAKILVSVLSDANLGPAALRAIAGALGNVCSNDDAEAAGSRAFALGIKLGKELEMGAAVLAALRKELARAPPASAQGEEEERGAGADVDVGAGDRTRDAGAVAALLRGLQRVSVNDELCERACEAGALVDALGCVCDPAAPPRVVAAALQLLGQLAGNDRTRSALVAEGFLESVPGVYARHARDAAVVEPLLRVLGMALLRNPAAAERAFGSGCLESVADALQSHAGTGAVCRQCCQVIRNTVVRLPELRAPLLAMEGLEEGVRKARAAHPECRDVGSAALRDLGLEYHGATEQEGEGASLDYYYKAL